MTQSPRRKRDTLSQISDAPTWHRWLPTTPRIAIAEDDPDLRALMVRGFERDGYAVDALADGAALMAYLDALMALEGPEPPDAIVSDVCMPGYSGFDALELLADVAWDLPFVVITAFADRSTRACAAMLGAVRVVDKPFQLDELKRVVEASLVQRELQRRC